MNTTLQPLIFDDIDPRGLAAPQRLRILHHLAKIGIDWHRPQVERIRRDDRNFFYPPMARKEGRL